MDLIHLTHHFFLWRLCIELSAKPKEKIGDEGSMRLEKDYPI